MFSLFRNRFGIPGAISVIALVFAMVGGAYAANGADGGATTSAKKNKKKRGNPGLNGKQKREVIRLAKRFAGKDGPMGPQGVPGVPGIPGVPGVPGAKGADGDDGDQGPKGATGAQGPQGEKGDKGDPGDPWTVGGTLPSGETLTGPWLLLPADGAFVPSIAQLPFNIPLAAPVPKEKVHYVSKKEINEEEGEEPPAACQGNADTPTAQDGHLCVYERAGEPSPSAEIEIKNPATESFGLPAIGAAKSGAVLWELGYEGFAWGTWAVTAE